MIIASCGFEATKESRNESKAIHEGRRDKREKKQWHHDEKERKERRWALDVLISDVPIHSLDARQAYS